MSYGPRSNCILCNSLAIIQDGVEAIRDQTDILQQGDKTVREDAGLGARYKGQLFFGREAASIEYFVLSLIKVSAPSAYGSSEHLLFCIYLVIFCVLYTQIINL